MSRQRLSIREHAAPYNYEFELKHKAIIDRFGRYPHRNQILGRVSSTDEIEFLKQPGSSFRTTGPQLACPALTFIQADQPWRAGGLTQR